MKKSITLILVLTLILGAFAVIGNHDSDEGTEQDALSVAVVVSSAFGDKSFNDSAREGTELLKEDLGINVEYFECNNEGIKQQLMNAAENADVVVAVGWQCYEISEVAPEHPSVKFILVDNPAEGIADIPNLISITYAQNEGSFLAGYIAASMSKSGIIGAVGGEDSQTTNDFIVGYRQGAKHADPDIKIEKIYAGDYEDPELGEKCAQVLIDKGADVIFNVAGNTGNGIFAAAQESSLYAIGVDTDQKLTYPEYDDVIICSMKKEVGQSLYDVIWAYAEDGTWNGGKVMVTDIASGHISIAYGDENSTQQVSDSLKAEVEELAKKIVSGDIKVKTTRK
jgi:basic membrane protein A